MSKPAKFEVRSVYGVPRAYPTDDAALALCTLAGTQTMDRKRIETCQELGYTIELAGAPSEIEKFNEGNS